MDLQRLLKCKLSDEEKGQLYIRLWGWKDKAQLFGLPDNVLEFALKTIAAEGYREQIALPPDRDEEWVNTVCKPFDKPPLTLGELKKAMDAPLLERLPVSWKRYGDLQRAYGDEAAQKLFATPGEYRAEDASGIISVLPGSSMDFGGNPSESMWEGVYDLCFVHLWFFCVSKLRARGVEVNRNVSDPSGSTAKKLRPDLLLWIFNRLIFKAEHKRFRDEIEEAWCDLVSKMEELDLSFYGPVEWILGMATGAGLFRFGAFKIGYQDYLSPYLELKNIHDRYSLLRYCINILRIAISWAPVFEACPMVRPYDIQPLLRYGPIGNQITRRIYVDGGIMTKTIRPWKLHVAQGYTKLEHVQVAYCIGGPHLIGGGVSVSRDKYFVELSALGVQRHPSEADLPQALSHVLQALQALHGKNLVHREVRWPNVVYNFHSQSWMLVDLETVWENDEVPADTCWLTDWDGRTLVDGKYTVQSDLYMLGKMMDEFHLTSSEEGREIRDKLKTRKYADATAALVDINAWKHSTALQAAF